MELDKRIKEGKRPLTCFDLKEASDFLEKTGYFTNELDYFSDLSETGCFSEVRFGRLLKIYNNKRCAFKYLSMDGSYENSYRFFLPEDWVLPKEKKYRPYTMNEFKAEFKIGMVLTLRNRDTPDYVCQVMYLGNRQYDEFDSDNNTIFLSQRFFSLRELFNMFEIVRNGGEWQPFGVMEDD